MAQKATVFKAELQVNDLDRHYYQTHALTLARHASETDERMMVRLVAFALNADPALSFGNGLSTADEPDLWVRDLTGAVTLWIDVGMPELKLIRRAAGRANRVVIYAYGRGTDPWWNILRADLHRIDNLAIFRLATESTTALAAMVARTMRVHCLIQDGLASVSGNDATIEIGIDVLKEIRQRQP
ncbi:MAG: YaeQ family protein [Betaproteobacteria bacterium]|nr:YaeQ family protein [Betaproteobacteria bacterium]